MNGTGRIGKSMYMQYVQAIIDGLVKESDFPVTAKVLEESGIADRKMLRKMERKGLLKSMRLTANGTHVMAYFSDDVLPKYERERRAKENGEDYPAEQTGAGGPEQISQDDQEGNDQEGNDQEGNDQEASDSQNSEG